MDYTKFTKDAFNYISKSNKFKCISQQELEISDECVGLYGVHDDFRICIFLSEICKSTQAEMKEKIIYLS